MKLTLAAPILSLAAAFAALTTFGCSSSSSPPGINGGDGGGVDGGCIPAVCPMMACGTIPDGCGHTLTCGTCTTPLVCGGGGTPNECGQLPADLLYVSPSSPLLANLSSAAITALNQSPYDAFAFPVAGPNDATPPTIAQLQSAVNLAVGTSKQSWPWVYLNRIVGKVAVGCTGTCCTGSCPAGAPCNTITGLDLYDTSGGETALLAAMSTAGQFAAATNAPGIVFDTETYSNECMGSVANIATALGKTQMEVQNQLVL